MCICVQSERERERAGYFVLLRLRLSDDLIYTCFGRLVLRGWGGTGFSLSANIHLSMYTLKAESPLLGNIAVINLFHILSNISMEYL